MYSEAVDPTVAYNEKFEGSNTINSRIAVGDGASFLPSRNLSCSSVDDNHSKQRE